MFGFRNPGNSRLPIEQALRGGESDCRNRILHQMFLLIGLGERAGSGIPKIFSGWKSQHWRPPALYEKLEPDQTLLELRMVDLLPDEVVNKLQATFGKAFSALDYSGRMILATAAIERVVTHTRLVEICDIHPHDLTLLLKRLVKENLLISAGRSRGMVYHLPGELLPTPEQVFLGPARLVGDPAFLPPPWNESKITSEYSEHSSEHLPGSSEHLADSDNSRDANGCLLSPHLEAPMVDSLERLDGEFRHSLEQMAAEPRLKQKLPKPVMRDILVTLCRDQYITLSALAKLVERNPDALRQQYLNAMVKAKQIQLAFPLKPTHERQAYRSVSADAEP